MPSVNEKYVIDSSALLAIVLGEPVDQRVAGFLETGVISTVNLSEAVAKMSEHGFDLDQTMRLLNGLGYTIADFNRQDAYTAGRLRQETRHMGLSFGDRACLALAIRERLGVLTADKAWAKLNLDIKIEMIR